MHKYVQKLLIVTLITFYFIPINARAITNYQRLPTGFYIISPVSLKATITTGEIIAQTESCGAMNPPIKAAFAIQNETEEYSIGDFFTTGGTYTQLFYIESSIIKTSIRTYNLSGTFCKEYVLEYADDEVIFVPVTPNMGFYCSVDGTKCEFSETTKDYLNFNIQKETIFFGILMFLLVTLNITNLIK